MPSKFDRYNGQEKRAFIKLKTMKTEGRKSYCRKVLRDPTADPKYKAALNKVAQDNPGWMDPAKARPKKQVKPKYDASNRNRSGREWDYHQKRR